MFRTGRFKNRSAARHEVKCRCDHEQITHYTADGRCVFPGCGCAAYKPKGRAEYSRVKRAKCEYGHSHDSGLEVRICFDLHCQRLAGVIRDFEFHKVVDLLGRSGRVVKRFETDFIAYYPDGVTEIIEAKGRHLVRDQGWQTKWAFLMDQHWQDTKYRFRVITD